MQEGTSMTMHCIVICDVMSCEVMWCGGSLEGSLNGQGSFVVCCSVLQCVAVCCSVLQCVAVCCSVL